MRDDDKVYYRAGYKYQLARDFRVHTSIFPQENIFTKFIILKTNGELIVRNGYAHDGASGPTFDTRSTFRAATAHDAVYQLIRLGLLDPKWREVSDDLFGRLMTEDLAWWEPKLRVKLWVRALKKLGSPSADPKHRKKIHQAP